MSEHQPIKPAFAWPGGKRWAVPMLLPMIAARPHICYAEMFAGGLALLCAKEPSKVEVVNDLNGDMVRLYRVAKYHWDELCREMALELNSRELYYDYQAQPGLTDIQRAARWFRAQKMAFGGNIGSGFAVGKTGRGCPSVANGQEALRKLSGRLDTVQIENLDWRRFHTLYDAPTTLFFADPPYVGGDPGSSYSAWSLEQFEAFFQQISQGKSDWIMTINDTPEIREIVSAHPYQAVSRKRGIANKGPVASNYGELIVARQEAEAA